MNFSTSKSASTGKRSKIRGSLSRQWPITLASIALIAIGGWLPAGSAQNALLTWNPPTTYTDGSSPLTVAGYRLYSGCLASGQYERPTLTIGPTASYDLGGLPTVGTCYFALASFDSFGGTSVLSNEASKLMGALVAPGNPSAGPTITWNRRSVTILATDDFTRANNNDIGTAWDPNTAEASATGFKISSNTAIPSAGLGSDASETNNTTTWPDDQYAEVTIGSPAADGVGPGMGPIVRSATGAITYFAMRCNASGYRVVYKVTGSFNLLVDSSATTFADGDKAYLSVQTSGGNTTWIVKKNGVQINTGTLATPIASGRPGIIYSSTSSSGSLKSFEAGDLSGGGSAFNPTPIVDYYAKLIARRAF